MTEQTYQEMLYEVKDGVCLITLNRPRALNAFNLQLFGELSAAIDRVRTSDDVRCLVITGNGRAFCSGADVSDRAGTPRPTEADAKEFTIHERISGKGVVYGTADPQGYIKALARLWKPVIAAVNGPAVGAGMGLALNCDIRLASDKAIFGEAYIRRGTFASGGDCWYLPRVIGLPRALELLMTGDIIDAQEAYRVGVVNHVYAHDDLMPKAMEMAHRLAKGPWSTRLFKQMTYYFMDMDLDRALELTRMSSIISHASQDALEGRRAFREKREPVFKGK